MNLFPDFPDPSQPLCERLWGDREMMRHPQRGIVNRDFQSLLASYSELYGGIGLGLIGAAITTLFTASIFEEWRVRGTLSFDVGFLIGSLWLSVVILALIFGGAIATAESWKRIIDLFVGSSLGAGGSINRYIFIRIILGAFCFALGLYLAYLTLLFMIGDEPHFFIGWIFLFMAITILALGTFNIISIPKELRSSSCNVTLVNLPKPVTTSSRQITISHWSDLHLTASDQEPLVEDRLLWRRKASSSNTMFARLIRLNEWNDSDAIVVTGDITDSGIRGEWEVFRNFIERNSTLLKKMAIVPGNHDVNIMHKATRFKAEFGDRVYLKLRLIRMILAMDMIQGERSHIVTDGGKLKRLRDVIDSFGSSFIEFIQDPPRKSYSMHPGQPYALGIGPYQSYQMGGSHYESNPMSDHEQRIFNSPEECWAQIFPMIIPVPTTNVAIVVCNSVKIQRNMVDNALGEIETAQLLRLQNIGRLFPEHALVYALHHHIKLPALPQDGRWLHRHWSNLEVKMMALSNAEALLNALPQDRKCVVLHGHRHYEYEGHLNAMSQVFSARSTTLGGQTQLHRPGYCTYRFGVDGNSISLSGSNLVEL
jgi:hypothetical protein